MSRTIIWIMTVFLLGLIAVVGVSTWKFQAMRDAIIAERDGNIALFRLGSQAEYEVQAIEIAVENLFKTGSTATLDEAQKILLQHLTDFTDVITTIQDPKFTAPLSAITVTATIESAEGTEGAKRTQGEPLQKLVDILLAGKDQLKEAVTKVAGLASTRLKLRTSLVGAKNDLSRVARKTFDLNTVDAKAYSSLIRGVIATVSTDSAADLKFVGMKIYEDSYATISKATISDDQKANLTALHTQFMATYDIVREYLSTASDAEFFQRITEVQLKALKTLVKGTEIRFDQGQDDLTTTASTTITTTLILAGTIALICLVMGVIMTRRMTGPLARTVARMSAVSAAIESGDLTARVEHSGKDEVSAMAKAINATLDQLREAMTKIGTSVRALSTRSGQLNDISSKLDDASANASAMTTELSATAQQVSASIQSVSAGIEEFSAGANEIAKSTGDAAVMGREAMEQARSAEKTMGELTKASQQIGSIIAVIEAITEQTKLLALNATIEAARAGDAGRGFAVVANEVKTLATKTATAAGDIRAQVDAIRRGSSSVSSAITAVATTIAKVNDFQQSIAGAVEEQAATTRELATHLAHAATGGAEIATGVGEVAGGAKTNGEYANTVLTTAKDLATTSTELDGLVGRFHF